MPFSFLSASLAHPLASGCLRLRAGRLSAFLLACMAVSLPLSNGIASPLAPTPRGFEAPVVLSAPPLSQAERIRLVDREIEDLYSKLQDGSPTDITKDFPAATREPALEAPPEEESALTGVEAIQQDAALPASPPSEAISTPAVSDDSNEKALSPKAQRKAEKRQAKAQAQSRQEASDPSQKAATPPAPQASSPKKPSVAESAALEAQKQAAAETQAALKTLKPQLQGDLQQLSERMHFQHDAIRNELRDDQELALTDITLLWQSAVERSGAIRYAIEKLSRRDATGKTTGDSFTKRVFQNIVRLGGVAGSMWTGTPAGVLSGSLVEDMLRGDPTTSAMGRVTDADMLLLAKEVEALQTQVIESYYAYRQAQDQWKLSHEALVKLDAYYQRILEAPENADALALKPVLDSMFEGLQQEESNAKQGFVSARNALGLLVGGDALLTLEQSRQTPAAKTSTPTKATAAPAVLKPSASKGPAPASTTSSMKSSTTSAAAKAPAPAKKAAVNPSNKRAR
ncbi:MAG: hypothetical protein IPK79_10640 [Vampirovibrionales bacterium]|nr:hypothetical protein [Vampirovibrionales bacterium]